MIPPEIWGEILQKLLDEKKFELPMYWVSIGANGAFLIGKYVQSVDGETLDCDLLAEGGKDFQLPINMMFVDPRGQAARVLIKGPGNVEYLG